MGFGHAVYRVDDPRAGLLRDSCRALAIADPALADRVAFAIEVEARVLDLLEQHRPGRGLQTNVEYWAALVLEACRIPPELFTSVFGCSRMVGWTAHALEQADDPRIIRPSARYTGPPPRRVAGPGGARGAGG